MKDRYRNSLIEIWQANAAGRYRHPVDQHNAPLDPNFIGAGRCVTNAKGGVSLFNNQAGRLPLAQSCQCLAAGAYSSVAVRAEFRDPFSDAVLFSRRSSSGH